MQRTHQKDVSGVALAKESGYTHLMIPQEFEPKRKCFTSIGFEDPRTVDGELAWPERFPAHVIERDRVDMTAYAWASQMQQRPAPRGGGMVKREWFEFVDYAPKEVIKRTRGWDLAASETVSAAYTAGVRMSRGTDGFIYVEHAWHGRVTAGSAEAKIKQFAVTDPAGTRIGLPQDPGQAGKAQKRYLVAGLVGHIVRATPESGSKETRFEPFAAQAEGGNVRIVRGLWNDEFLDELEIFPFGEFKDFADATSRAFMDLIPPGVEYGFSQPKVVHG